MKKFFVIGMVILGLIVFGFLFRLKNGEENLDEPQQKTEKIILLTEVSLHNNKNDCWIVIDKVVYDITNFISKHPGGDIIVTVCGKDATSQFNSRPNLGTSHSNLARKMLGSMKVGTLN